MDRVVGWKIVCKKSNKTKMQTTTKSLKTQILNWFYPYGEYGKDDCPIAHCKSFWEGLCFYRELLAKG